MWIEANEPWWDIVNELKNSGINGCITGSCMLMYDKDFSEWDDAPDIDVFVYSEGSFINAIDILRYKYGFKPGDASRPESEQGEQWKIDKTIKSGMRRDSMLNTVKLNNGKVTVNISYRKHQTTLLDVISNFDMSIIMIGYDIPTGLLEDLRFRGGDIDTARPNPYREQETDMYTTAQWVRQFDRVIKYWNRGFDTRPMAEFYIEQIDKTLANGSLFQTEKSIQYYNEFAKEFKDVRERIVAWLEDKKEV